MSIKKCEHGKQKAQSKDCGGSAFCEHGNILLIQLLDLTETFLSSYVIMLNKFFIITYFIIFTVI